MRAKPVTEENITAGIGINCQAPWRLTKVTPMPAYLLEVTFVDGTQGVFDMTNLIMGNKAGAFATLRDVNLFNQVTLNFGAATWPSGLDLAPDLMHTEIQKYGNRSTST